MSETPPKPDGSDPRVLTPGEDEPEVKIAKQHTQAYHTADCRTIYRMRERGIGFKTVKQSVAEWQDLHECEICCKHGEYDPDAAPDTSPDERSPDITAAMCDAWRTYLGNGMAALDIIDTVPYGETNVRNHLKGNCECEPDAPPYTYGWHAATDPPEPTTPKGHGSVAPRTCYALRDRLLDGGDLADAAKALNMSKSTARNHAKGRCPHHNSTPPLEQGWYVNE